MARVAKQQLVGHETTRATASRVSTYDSGSPSYVRELSMGEE